MSQKIVNPSGKFGDRRGVAAGFVALMAVALVGMAALSVDLGVLLAARTEAQRAADAGALSGALSLLESPGDEIRARDKAIEYAGMNAVHGSANTVLTGDVDVILAQDRVRVRVIRDSDRSNRIGNFFARILGFNTSMVSAMAAAHAGVANGVNCPLPFVVVDRWWDTSDGELAETTDQYDPLDDVYVPGPIETLPGSPTLPTGYGRPDRGQILRIYPGSPGENPLPGWAFLLNLNDPGGNEVMKWIKGCGDASLTFEYDQLINIENGMKTGPVDHGFTDVGDGLINQDPNAYWGTGVNAPAGGCVFRPGVLGSNGEPVCVSSPRAKAAFLIRPTDIPPKSGNTDVRLRNFVGLFVICVGELKVDETGCTPGSKINDPNGGVWVRFIDYRGVKVAPAGEHTGSLVRVLQLIE